MRARAEEEGDEMAKFMALYRSSVSARGQMANATPEQMQAGMDAWMAWAGKAGDAIVDLGTPLAAATRLGSGSSAAGGDDISGYSILQSDSVEALSSRGTWPRLTSRRLWPCTIGLAAAAMGSPNTRGQH